MHTYTMLLLLLFFFKSSRSRGLNALRAQLLNAIIRTFTIRHGTIGVSVQNLCLPISAALPEDQTARKKRKKKKKKKKISISIKMNELRCLFVQNAKRLGCCCCFFESLSRGGVCAGQVKHDATALVILFHTKGVGRKKKGTKPSWSLVGFYRREE